MVLSRMFKRHLNQKSKQKLLPFEILMGGVSVYSIVVVIVQLSLPEGSQMRALFTYYDTMACVIFIMGIFFHFFTEPHRWRYLVSWGVLDMASAIPGMPLLRFIRVIRVLRLLRIAHKPSDLNEAIQRAPTASLIYLMILVLLTIYSSCCAGVLYFEGKHNHTSINSGADALWFGLVTVSTVGYGGFIPETLGARICAALLMVSGIGVFASLAGFLLEPLRRLAQGGIQKTSTEDLASQITELQIMLQKHLEKAVEDLDEQQADDDEPETASEGDPEEG